MARQLIKTRTYILTIKKPVKDKEPYKSNPEAYKTAKDDFDKLVKAKIKDFKSENSHLKLIDDVKLEQIGSSYAIKLIGTFEEE